VQQCAKFFAAASLFAAAVGLTACEASKSSNPLSASVAGPIPGINITAPTTTTPTANSKIAVANQPVTLTIQNAGTNGPRPLTYSFQIASDAEFNTVVFNRDAVTPGANGQTSLKLTDTLATGYSYFWRTRAQDGANTGPYSAIAMFSVYTPIVINAPALASPAQGATVSSVQPSLVVVNAAHSGPVGAITYLAEVADNAAFANRITMTAPESAGQTTLMVPQALAYATVYYWHVLAADPTTIGPFSITQAFTTPAAPVVAPPASSGGSGGSGGGNFPNAVILANPPDLASWPQTATITNVQFQGGGPFLVDFDKRQGSGRWPDVQFGDGSLQYTLGMCVNPGSSGWYCSAVVQFWYGRDLNASGPASAIGSEWFYDPGRWGPIVGYQPQVGETVGLFVAAGNLRGSAFTRASCPMVCERSNVQYVSWEVGLSNAISSMLKLRR
jgi:hypothetical protein